MTRERASRDPSWRCRLSYAGDGAYPTHPSRRLGRVVGESKDGQYWYVLWDGLDSKAKYHKDHIRILRRGFAI